MGGHVGLEGRVVAADHGRDHALRRQHLAVAHQRDLARHVVGQRQRAAQRHLLGRVAAHHGVVHAEVDVPRGGIHHLPHLHAALGQVGRQRLVGRGQVDELGGHAEQVELAVQEGQPARLALFDDGDLHAVQQRQRAAAHLLRHGLAQRVGGRGLFVVHGVPVHRVALQHDARAAHPRPQLEGPGAHGALHAARGVGLDDLARHGAAHARRRKHIGQARRGLGHAHLEGVAVERPDAVHLDVVGEGRLRLEGLGAQLAQAQQAHVLVLGQHGAAGLGVVVALDAVDVVLRDQLALAPLEGRVVAEADARLQPEDEARVVRVDFGHRHGGVGLEPGGPRQVVVGQRRIEEAGHDGVGHHVGHLRRVEAAFAAGKGHAQHLRGRSGGGLGEGRCRRQAAGQQQGQGCQGHRPGVVGHGRARVGGPKRGV